MLKAESLVVLGKHVRSLLVHHDRVTRVNPANSNAPVDDDVDFYNVRVSTTKPVQPSFKAVSSGHGPGT